MYCEDCNYWREPNNKMGMCLKTIDGWEAGVGTMADLEWEAGIYTGPKFGCIHFKPAYRPMTTKRKTELAELLALKISI
tara:strand:- start:261 stop:497 length:237 start_codon:yes stop_codon:yes gene_type:complete